MTKVKILNKYIIELDDIHHINKGYGYLEIHYKIGNEISIHSNDNNERDKIFNKLCQVLGDPVDLFDYGNEDEDEIDEIEMD